VLTLSLWFKTTADGPLISYQNAAYPDLPTEYIPILYVGTDGKLRAQLWYGGIGPMTTPVVVNDGQWHHAAFSFDSVKQSLYLDGIFISSMDVPFDHFSMSNTYLGYAYMVDWPSAPQGHFFFNGQIDDIRLWNAIRSEADIQSDMSTPLVGSEAGLLEYWALDEGTGQVSWDVAGNPDVRLGTGAAVAADDPAWIFPADAPVVGIVLDAAGNAMDGEHIAALPSGDGAQGGTFSSLFTQNADLPETSIVDGPPSDSASASATFLLSSPAPSATFERSLDGAGYVTVGNPDNLTSLSEGNHTYAVRAVNTAGNRDPTPAVWTWNVDLTPPDTQFTSTPPASTGETSATFDFSSTETGSQFERSLDASPFTPVTGPETIASLSVGSHTYQVRAIDQAGNVDPTPASYTWTVTGTVQIPIQLNAGYTLIALPLTPQSPYTAASLAAEVNGQGGTCTAVLKYDGGAFTTHVVGSGIQNFTVDVGKGYFLRCTAGSTWTVTGTAFTATSVPLSLSAGYNLVGLPIEPDPANPYTAARVGSEAGTATQVLQYVSGAFQTHVVGAPGNNFTLEAGRGYFVRCSAPATWTVTR
jgi:hypothetical protein